MLSFGQIFILKSHEQETFWEPVGFESTEKSVSVLLRYLNFNLILILKLIIYIEASELM